MAPKDFEEFNQMLEYAVKTEGPVVIRYPRGGEGEFKFRKHNVVKDRKSEILKTGKDVTIIGIGKTVSKAMEIAKELENSKINAEVINARFLKPFDAYNIVPSICKTKFVVTIEDNVLNWGLGSTIKELIISKKIKNIKIKSFGYPDKFIKHGTPKELEKIYGLDNMNIINYIKCILKK